ncbi:MAG: YXWGXW repeat-containing protein [Terracidiphilus sp.]
MRTIRILLAFLALAIPATLFGQIRLSISIGPPALPVYEQPICPGDGYLWTPGYWAYDDSVSDYYWVDGEWVMAPEEGFLWTPGYWAWENGGYRFNQGYWGSEVGFYGGINYGFGYSGDGYDGGRWDHGQFFYNRSDNNVDVARNRNVYDSHFSSHNESRVSFNGGNGGIEARATSEQEAAGRQRHVTPVALQIEHEQIARVSPEYRSSVNHGKPPVAAVIRPEAVNNRQTAEPARVVEPSRPEGAGASVEPRVEPLTKQSENNQARKAVHPNDLAPISRPEPTNSGNAKADKKYQQQQDNLIARQNQERQSLQQKQDSEHQRLTQQKASDSRTQQVEQKHQQQTQQLSNKHVAQQQSLQARQPQPKQQNKQDRPDKKN